MELKLQEFIASIEKMADLRNMDEFNPVVISMQKPATSVQMLFVASKMQPSYLGVPVNSVWVVLDPANPYFRKALKLRDTYDANNYASELSVPHPEAELWWTIVRSYSELWSDPQYYVGNRGPKGDKGVQGDPGPAGAKGDKGDPGTSPPLSEVACSVKNLMQQYVGTLEILGAGSIIEGQSQLYSIMLTLPPDPCTVNSTAQTLLVKTPLYIRGSNKANVNDNAVTCSNLTGSENATLYAYYPSWGKLLYAEKQIVLTDAYVTNISIQGPSSVYGGDSIDLTVLATYSDNTTSTITSGCTLLVDNPSIGNISNVGRFTAAQSADGKIVVTATYTSGGNTFSTTHTIVVNLLLPISLNISGASQINENQSSQYSTTVTYNNGKTVTVIPTYSILPQGAPAGISSLGVLSANSVDMDVSISLHATFIMNMTSVVSTKSITIRNVAVAIAPYYGVGPDTVSDFQTFITSLAYRGNPGNRNFTFSLDVIGATTYQWAAWPKSYGMGSWKDDVSNFVGGMGGAGATGPGPSQATLDAGEDRPMEITIKLDNVDTTMYVWRSENPNLGKSEFNNDPNFSLNKWTVL